METVGDPAEVILGELVDLEVERARVEAKIAERMLAFAEVRREQAQGAANARIRDLEISFVADELGLVLHQPTRTVQCRLATARRVRDELPRTWLAHRAGKVDGWRVSLIGSAVDKLADDQSVLRLDQRVGAYAASHTGSQTKAWLNRFVAAAEPAAVAERTKVEQTRRGVWVNHQDDGMSYLTAYLPTADAVRIDQLLTTKTRNAPADGRNLDNRRADLLCDLLLDGDGHGTGAGAGRAAVIGVTVPVTTLAGTGEDPATSFDGTFALPADMVRDLAAEPGTLFHRLLTDPLGRILDITEIGRFPSPQLRIAIHARDGTCLFPTCERPAAQCDLDHEIPHPDGPTTGSNLGPLCRRHHLFKTHQITDPRRATTRAHEPSHPEHDLANWNVRLEYAA